MAHRFGQHGVVIGGSLAGLMSAWVLAEHFDAVTALERDLIAPQPALHKSIPQGHHVHGLPRRLGARPAVVEWGAGATRRRREGRKGLIFPLRSHHPSRR
jgi:hypothetical protein